MKVFSNKILFLRIIKNIPQIMDIQRHSSVLGDTVEKLSDEASYKQLFHAYRDEEALPSGEVLKEICLLYTSPSPRDGLLSRMPSSA